MAKIYVSEETLDKFSNSKEFQKYSGLFNRFNTKHQNQEQSHKAKQSPTSKVNNLTQKESKLDPKLEIQNALQIMKESLAKTRNNYTYSPQKAHELSQMFKTKKRIHLAKTISKPAQTKTIKLKTKHKPLKNTSKPLAHISDHNNLASEYELRQVEFGHGRVKSKEWNDEIAKSLQEELRKARKQKPDWTDRFALK